MHYEIEYLRGRGWEPVKLSPQLVDGEWLSEGVVPFGSIEEARDEINGRKWRQPARIVRVADDGTREVVEG